MSQNVSKVKYSETNNHKQGRSGSGTPMKPGPLGGKVLPTNPTKSGGIFRPTKSN